MIRVDDAAQIVPINVQINGSENAPKSKSLVIAPSVHRSESSKVDLDGIVLMKKMKKKKKKKRKKKKGSNGEHKGKKRKIEKDEGDHADRRKRRKLSPTPISSDQNAKHKLSEWERE